MSQKLNLLEWLNLFCVFAFVFLIFYLFRADYTSFDIYTERDIQRAMGWLAGKWHWPGPEMTTGSSLPGPLFYFLLFPPLIFGESAHSQSLIWHYLWLSLTYTTAFHFASRIIQHKDSLFLFILFLISIIGGSLFQPLEYAWNASFAVLFHLLAIINLYYWRETGKTFYLYLSALVIGLGIQVHFFVLIHLLTVCFFFALEKKKKLRPFLFFALLFLLPSLPFLLMYEFNTFTVSSYSTKYPSKIISNAFSYRWFRILSWITGFKPYLAGPFLLLCALIIQKAVKGAGLSQKLGDKFF
ncbi:MAG: hypothetical protein OXN83_00905, partial [Oligoflexia bacterium]|nr:hypothetical protein [Oligoflexia bacterium]